MARFRRRSRSRSKGFGFKRRSRRSGSSGGSQTTELIAFAGYGATRPMIASAVSPVTNMMGFAGGYADNIALGGIGYLAAKKGKGLIRSFGKAMLYTEAYQLGSELMGGIGAGAGNSGGAF